MPTSACPFRSDRETIALAHGTHDAGLRPDAGRRHAREGPRRSRPRRRPDRRASTRRTIPKARGFRISAVPLRDELTPIFRTTLLVLLGTAGFVLLIVCASVANLMLARMVRREREVAIRGALGASRLRLLRQLLTESTLLALAGGLVGLGWRTGALRCWSCSSSASRRAPRRSPSIRPFWRTRSSSRWRPASCSDRSRRLNGIALGRAVAAAPAAGRPSGARPFATR